MKRVLLHLRHSAWFKMIIKAGLTLLAFWFVFEGIDFDMLRDMLHKQDHTLLLFAVLIMIAQIAAGAVRWRLILDAVSESAGHAMHYLNAFVIFYISIFFTCCLPGTVGGDVVRVWLTRSDKIPLSVAIHSVIIDRMIALVALGLMVIVTLPVLGSMAHFNPLMILPFVAMAVIGGIWVLLNLERLITPYKHIRVINWLLYFLESLKLILRRRVASCKSFVLALVTHSLYCISAYMLAQSIHIQITTLQCITLIPPVLLATTIPVSIGGWGIREAGMIALMGMIGVSQGQALMLSIQLGAMVMLITLPASVLWLFYRKHSPMDKNTLMGAQP